MSRKNVITATDSYKLTHWKMYPADLKRVYSYLEAREGAKYPYVEFFGLQAILTEHLVGQVVTWEVLQRASKIARANLGPGVFNYKGWEHILSEHKGKLPLEIKAVPEGTVVPVGNVLATVCNTCPECAWLTNAVESLLLQVWYPTTVATLSHSAKGMLSRYLEKYADDLSALPYMLHDFGFRGATGVEAAELGGMAHLTNFIGTDTLPALLAAIDYYAAEIEDPDNPLGLSVPASEHSVMTILGANGEYDQLANLLEKYPKGILSVVADSYDIYEFVNRTCDEFKDQILERDGRLVIRPDSVTPQHPNPESLVVWIAETLWKSYGGEQNRKSMRVLDDHVRILWGDGLDPKGMERILAALVLHNFSPENIVFGMGGGLLQKVNRDTQRFKIAASAAEFADGWHEDVQKLPLQVDKQSKAGRLALIEGPEGYRTVSEHWVTETGYPNLLKPVFLNGDLVNEQTFDEVRERAGADFRELVAA